MGKLRDVIRKVTLRRENKDTIIGGNVFGYELLYITDTMFYQSGDEIYIAKNRFGKPGFVKLPDLINLIVRQYFNSDMTETLSPSAMFNVSIKEDLEKVIKEVLIKHSLLKE